MSRNTLVRSVRVVMVFVIFGAGYLCGSNVEHNAHAQFGDLGAELLQQAAGSGGVVGNIAQLGTTITDMEKNVSGLQKNLDTLKAVKAALGGKK